MVSCSCAYRTNADETPSLTNPRLCPLHRYIINTLSPHGPMPSSPSSSRPHSSRAPLGSPTLSSTSSSHDYSDDSLQDAETGAHKRPPRAGTSPLGIGLGMGVGSTVGDRAALSTVVGLLAHSLADGISLGAACLSSSSSSNIPARPLDLLIFLAITLHKAPTAFALATLLLAGSCSPGFVRRALWGFSLAAPLAAIGTYALLRVLGAGVGGREGESGDEGKGAGELAWWTGMALVFSGGTFLFVATHVMERRKEADGELLVRGVDEEGAAAAVGAPMGERVKMALVLAGMITPGILSRLVGHGH